MKVLWTNEQIDLQKGNNIVEKQLNKEMNE